MYRICIVRFFIPFILLTLLWGMSFAARGSTSALIKPAPYAKHITTLDGISLGQVNSLYQSRNGYLWFATNEGLVRFDGYNAKRFAANAGDPYSLNNNRVFDVTEEPNGTMWVSTYGGGLSMFSPQSGRFKPIDLTIGPNGPPVTRQLYNLTIDKERTMWIGSTQGVMRFDLNTHKAIALPKTLAVLPSGVLSTVYVDKQQHLWFTSTHKGLFRYDGKRIRAFQHDPQDPGSLSNDVVRSVYEDKKGNFWVTTQIGLDLLDRKTGRFSHFTPADHAQMTDIDNDIYSMISDKQGRLWLGSMGRGVFLFDPRNGEFTLVSGSHDLDRQFNRNIVSRIIKDRDGSLWFATQDGVINIPQPALQIRNLTNALGALKVTEIKQLKGDELTIFANYQVFNVNLDDLSATSGAEELTQPYRMSIDKNSDWWVATVGNGLMHWSPSRQVLTPHLQKEYSSSEGLVRGLFDVHVDQQQQVWALALPNFPVHGGGVVRFIPNTGKLEVINNTVTFCDIISFDDDRLLVSAVSKGLFWLDTHTNVMTPWSDEVKNMPKLINNIYKDSLGRLWVGTLGQGLGLFEPDKNAFRYYSTNDGLISNSIMSIIEDDDGNIWVGTSVGISRFDPQTGEVMNLEKEDGLLFSTFQKRAALKNQNGTIALGGRNGLVLFNPRDFGQTRPAAKVTINDFKLFNQSVVISSEARTTVLEKPIEVTEQLVLSHQDYVFSFHFSATEYLRPDKIQFAYTMKGLDDKWLFTDAKNRVASYTTLPAGDYVFKVKASNALGVYSSEASEIKVTILPPWWFTWQAKVMYVLMSIAAIVGIIKLNTRHLVQQAQVLEQSVAERTAQLVQKNHEIVATQLQLVQAEKMASLGTLTAGVAHEINNPTNYVTICSDSLKEDLQAFEQYLYELAGKDAEAALIEEWTAKFIDFYRHLEVIKNGSKRVAQIVEDLKLFSQLDSSDEKTVVITDMLRSTVNLMRSQHLGRIEFDLEFVDRPTLECHPAQLNQVFMHLIANACDAIIHLQQQSAHFKGKVIASCQVNENTIEISISDNGGGMSEQTKTKLFEPFYTTKETGKGTGLGLSTSFGIIKRHNGTLSVESELGNGSVFCIRLPNDSTPLSF